MAKVFISHSSADKPFVRDLARDLIALGHEPWLDEWEIKVGDCIVSKIESGVANSDYVVIVLSGRSVASGWVDREWKTKYWDEIEQERTMVLPVLIEDCDLPGLLKTKKYADFRNNYSAGFVSLTGAISPTLPVPQAASTPAPTIDEQPDAGKEVSDLLMRVQARDEVLSRLVAEALALGRRFGSASLTEFCTHELSGWSGYQGEQENMEHRLVQAYVSWTAEINMQAWQWGGKASPALTHIQRDTENFKPIKMIWPQPLSVIESALPPNPDEVLVSLRSPFNSLFPASDVEAEVNVYGSGYTHRNIVESVRQRLTKELLDMLPGASDA